MNYTTFLESKTEVDVPTGLDHIPELNPMLFDFQKDIVTWALKRGRAAIFADCGLGKTPMQLEWARHIPGRVLILAPLAVANQTVREGDKFGIPVTYARNQKESNSGHSITITNYEMLSHFEASKFEGIVLDESSILKSYTGKIRNEIISSFKETPFRLACTATPAPNDFMELGNHSEFLGSMSRTEMLSMFFVHDGGETQKWRIKGHAQDDFWKWLCSWAVTMRKPSDLGYDDNGFTLPELRIHQIRVESNNNGGHLFPMEVATLQERIQARRDTVDARVKACSELVNGDQTEWLIWCNLNKESTGIAKSIKGAVEITGSDKPDVKSSRMIDFTNGKIKKLVTKPSIAGFGMNWQHCSKMAFVGLSDSYEQFYQAVRRCWRFGQSDPVDVYVITADIEGAIVKNIERKEKDANLMAESMVKHMADINKANIKGTRRTMDLYKKSDKESDSWHMMMGDCVERMAEVQSDSVGYSIFSPPFSSLYTYSASDRDMGNCRDNEEFEKHFKFLIPELLRVTQPGRLLSFHCMNLPTSKSHHGYIGIRDFRGDLIRMFEAEGWIFHSEVVIWKDPVVAMQRTKALGLLHKQLVKDSCMSRQGIPDYVVTMRKPGINEKPVSGKLDRFVGDPATFQQTKDLSIDIWQRYASPIWMDINPSRTLQRSPAREEKDERHICPLQLDVIERCLQLWSNPRDLILSPFAGIGSEGYCAIKMDRRFVGIELKESYWKTACANLEMAKHEKTQQSMF